MDKKALNWEQLINDGENYGGMGDLSPHEKIVFESIKDNRLLKIQDSFLFSKKGKVEDNHGVNLATLIAGFEPLKDVTTLIITHNQLGPEGLQIIVNSKIISKICTIAAITPMYKINPKKLKSVSGMPAHASAPSFNR